MAEFKEQKSTLAAKIEKQRIVDKTLLESIDERARNRKDQDTRNRRYAEKLKELRQAQVNHRQSPCPVVPTPVCYRRLAPRTPLGPEAQAEHDALRRAIESTEANILRIKNNIAESRSAEYGPVRRTFDFPKSPDALTVDGVSPATTFAPIGDPISPSLDRTYRIAAKDFMPLGNSTAYSGTAAMDHSKCLGNSPAPALKVHKTAETFTLPPLEKIQSAAEDKNGTLEAISIGPTMTTIAQIVGGHIIRPGHVMSTAAEDALESLLRSNEDFPYYNSTRSTPSKQATSGHSLSKNVDGSLATRTQSTPTVPSPDTNTPSGTASVSDSGEGEGVEYSLVHTTPSTITEPPFTETKERTASYASTKRKHWLIIPRYLPRSPPPSQNHLLPRPPRERLLYARLEWKR